MGSERNRRERKRKCHENNNYPIRSKRFKRYFEIDQNNFNVTKLVKKLEETIDSQNDVELFSSLNIENGPFLLAFRRHDENSVDLMLLILKALGKVSASNLVGNSREILNNFIINILPNNVRAIDQNNFFNVRLPLFITTLATFIDVNQNEDVQIKYKDAVANLIKFLVKIQEICPRASIDVIKKICSNLLAQIQYINRDEEIFSNENIQILEEFLFNANQQIQSIGSDIMNDNENQFPKKFHFRSIPICPDATDVLTTKRPHLPENDIKGKYKDGVEQYLDIQFRLLREDFIRPLREGIEKYIQLMQQRRTSSTINIDDVNIYKNVRLMSSHVARNGDLIHWARFDLENLEKIDWKCSKRFLSGSLICLSSDNFATIKFATLAGEKDPNKLQNGEFQMKFENDDENIQAAINVSSYPLMTMIELTVFYEAYRHNLRVLQHFDTENFPLQRYIVEVERKMDPPAYLKIDTCYNLRPLGVDKKAKAIETKNFETVKILDKSTWPDRTYFGFDESQYEAFVAALTKQVAIIQGPPGTGKTYLGLRIMEALLLNKGQNKRTDLPILIVCYTNHALDQFLEEILPFCKKMVRIGGGSNSELLENNNLNAIKRKMAKDQTVPSSIFNRKHEKRNAVGKIGGKVADHCRLLKSTENNILYKELIEFICQVNNAHFETFLDKDKQHDGNFMVKWLGYEKIDCGTDKDEVPQLGGNVFKKDSRDAAYNVAEHDESEVDYIQNMRVINGDMENMAFDGRKNEKKQVLYKSIYDTKVIRKTPIELLQKSEMNVFEASQIRNILKLSHTDKWRLYRLWINLLKTKKQDELTESFKHYAELVESYKVVLNEEEVHICRAADVIGMTSTGAAKYRHIIDGIEPQIVVVEEAAEVLEAHITTALCSKTDHLILIGDHLQLKPNPAVHALAKEFNLETSLFERLIKNDLEYFQLKLQHRMRPEISSLLVPHIYKELFDHESVHYDSIIGVSHNVFFLNHNESDRSPKDSHSHYNIFEAKFATELCRYLILQGYEQQKITILTMYSGQLEQLRVAMRKYDELVNSVRIAVVDNFQGEENDIIIISLVRGNEKGKIGFLSTLNRINVGLSRAKKALYCIGNFDCLMKKSVLWQRIVGKAKGQNSFGSALTLYCQNHTDFKTTVSKAADFEKMPQGGCLRKCEKTLDCKHICPLTCHITDLNHINLKCLKTCNRKICKLNHRCRNKCFMCRTGCSPCDTLVDKPRSCGHIVRVACSKNPEDIACTTLRDKELPCGHTLRVACSEYPEDTACTTLRDKELPCGHKFKVLCCNLDKTLICKERCKIMLECGHVCSGNCCNCFQGRLHLTCQQKCSRILICGHRCQENCAVNCPPCIQQCAVRCSHVSCSLSCGETCRPCRKRCDWKCRHFHCTQLCNEPCDRQICTRSCKKRLRCGHACIGICGEFCPKLCRICDTKTVQELFLGHRTDARFLRLADCGDLIEIKSLLKWVQNTPLDKTEDKCIQAITCPKCAKPIGKSNALKKYTQSANADVKKIIAMTNGKAQDNQKTKLYETISSVKLNCNTLTFNGNCMNTIKGELLKQLKSSDLVKMQLNSIENTFNIWKRLVDFSSIYDKCEIIETLYPDNVSVETLREIKVRMTDLIQFLSSFKNTKQEISDIILECQIFELIGKTLEIASRGSFNDWLQALISQAIDLILHFDRTSTEKTTEKIKSLLNKASIEQSGMPVIFEEKAILMKTMNLASGQWFKCQNGHHYSKNECGGKCPKCQPGIGDSGHYLDL